MGGEHRPGTPRDRALGAELRAIREQGGLSLAEVAKAIQWSVSTVSRLERGQRHISPEAVMGLAMIYRLAPERRTELITRAKEPPTLGWWDRPPAGVPSDLGALASYEREAIRMTNWSPGIIPGLLQIPEYTTAIMQERGIEGHDLEVRVQARQRRQGLLTARRIDYTAFIGGAALTNRLCAPDVFVKQLRRLVAMANRDGVSIRLIELPTMFAFGGWALLNFDRTGPMVLLEHLDSSTFLFDQETQPYVVARQQLDELALSVRATQDKMTMLAEQLTQGVDHAE